MLRVGQTAVVTGAGSGIGRAIARALAHAGLRVLLVGRQHHKLYAVAAEIGASADVLPADLRVAEAAGRIAEAAANPLHVLVHSAGVYLRGDVTQLSGSAWHELNAVNLHAPLLVTAACLPALRAAQGSVVFVNSTAALHPSATVGAYAASKAALRVAADALRQEVNGDGVRVLSIFPGRTDTPMQAAILAEEGRSAAPGTLMRAEDVSAMLLAALSLPDTAEVTELIMRPLRKL
jgi:NADP-dependent 3-hydroxy acid dehydrogenase YdfG